MRRFTIIVLVFCVILMGGVLYIEYDTKKFIKNLQPLPSLKESGSTSTRAKPDTHPIEEKPSVDTQPPQGIVDSETEHAPDVHQPEPLHTPETRTRVDDADNLETPAPPLDAENESHADNVSTPEPLAPFEGLRKKLIEEHGDIPLLHTYIELLKKRQNKEPMTMDEVSTLWEAIMVFNPTPEHQKAYELIKRLASQADPDSFRVIYDPQELKELQQQGR